MVLLFRFGVIVEGFGGGGIEIEGRESFGKAKKE